MHQPDPDAVTDAPASPEEAPELAPARTPEEEAEAEAALEAEVIDLPASEPTEAERLTTRLRETEARLRTVSKAYTDLQAEMKSFRVRVEAQAAKKAVKQTAELVGALLEPVENLRRSIGAPGEDIEALVAGLKLVSHQFTDAMTRVGLQEIAGVGSLFDPNRHEALAMTPVTDRSMDGRILMVHTTGYVLGDNVLQPAQVIVGQYQAPSPEPEPAAPSEAAGEAADPSDETDA